MQRLKATQFTTGRLDATSLQDRLGKPAQLDGVPTWNSSDPAVVAVEASADGLSCKVTAVANGTAVVTLNGDASADEGLQPFVATEDFQVVSGDVVSGTIAFDAPSEQ